MSETATREEPRLLRALGIVGWNHLEPVILAALATESPLLLIGPHGSAKTLVLTRLADALGLTHRHYNASLLCFDDLVGFPVPDNGRLVYLQTPATIWDAESVLFDEISRCRPEVQNKLFPIVHEKFVQGIKLVKLRHRWGAMNPPPAAGGSGTGSAHEYAGAEPLDIALADRFGFIVPVPSLGELQRSDQLTLLRGLEQTDDAAPRLRSTLDAVRQAIPATASALQVAAAEYVQVLAQKLGDADHPMSARRALQLARNIIAVSAVQAVAAGSFTGPNEDAFYTAARYSLPDEGWGDPVPRATLLTAHRTAWQLAKLDERSDDHALVGVEAAIHRNVVFIDGRIAAGTGTACAVSVEEVCDLAREVFRDAGYGTSASGTFLPVPDGLDVRVDLCLGPLEDDERAVRHVSDDQAIAVGHAVRGVRAGYRPLEQALANDCAAAIEALRRSKASLGIGPDGKVLIVVRGRTLVGVSASVHHLAGAEWIGLTRRSRRVRSDCT